MASLPVSAGVCIKLSGDANLNLMLFCSAVGVAIIFALFPRTLLPRTWIRIIIAWHYFLAKTDPLSPNQREEKVISLSYHEFIGECYIHGMMDTQAIGYQYDRGIKVQTFELR